MTLKPRCFDVFSVHTSIIASIVSAEDTLKLIQTTRLQPRHSAQTLSDGYGKLNLGLMQGPTTSTSSSPSSPPSPRTHITAVHLVNQVATDRRFYLSGAGLGLAMGLYSKLFVYRIRILFDLLNRSTISIIYLYSLFKTYTYTEYFVNIYWAFLPKVSHLFSLEEILFLLKLWKSWEQQAW